MLFVSKLLNFAHMCQSAETMSDNYNFGGGGHNIICPQTPLDHTCINMCVKYSGLHISPPNLKS